MNGESPDGCSPLDVAGSGGGHRDLTENPEAMAMIRLLQQRGAKLTARSAVILGDEASFRKIATEEDVITPRDNDGWLLSLAVDCNRPAMLQLLLDLGLDPDARVRLEEGDRPTFTWGMPLYQCARYGKHSMAEMLLKRGADPNGQVYASGTPLSEAYGQRDEEMIALLERHGGNPTRPWPGCTGERISHGVSWTSLVTPHCPMMVSPAVR